MVLLKVTNLFNLKEKRTKKIILLVIISSLSLQALAISVIYGQKTPLGQDDYLGMFYSYKIATGKELQFTEFVEPDGIHIPFFERIVTTSFFLIDSFQYGPPLFFTWILLNFGILAMYLILRKNDERLTWLLIPISIVIFNPLQYFIFGTVLHGYSVVFPLVSFLFMIYFLNHDTLKTPIRVGLGLVLSFICMFSWFFGVLAWPVGILSLMKKKDSERKWLIIWIAIGIFLSAMYYLILEQGTSSVTSACQNNACQVTSSLLAKTGWELFLSIASLPFVLKYNLAYYVVGAILTFSFVSLAVISIFSKDNRKFIPWIQIGLGGLLFALAIAVGRIQDFNGVSSSIMKHYITLSELLIMGLLVLATILFLDWKNKFHGKRKIILSLVFMIFIIGQGVLFVPTYAIAYKLARDDDVYNKTQRYACLNLPVNDVEVCKRFLLTPLPFKIPLPVTFYNYFLINKINLWSNPNFYNSYNDEIQNFMSNWSKLGQISGAPGTIESINDHELKDTNKVEIVDEFIEIRGTILNNQVSFLKEVYIFLDDKPFVKVPINNVVTNSSDGESWDIGFLYGYLPVGCHKMSLDGYGESYKLINDQSITICK